MLRDAGMVEAGQFSSIDNDSQARLGYAAVLPEQFFGVSHAHASRPEAALMLAVLEEALTCFQYQFYLRRDKAQRLARDAEAWFFSDEADWPFAFVNICAVLRLDPSYIRRGLRRCQATWPLKIPQRKRRTVGTRRPLTLAA